METANTSNEDEKTPQENLNPTPPTNTPAVVPIAEATTKQTGRKSVDWIAVYAWYAQKNEDGTLRSLEDVANHFDINKSYVAVRSGREQWVDNRTKLYQDRANAVEEAQTNTIIEASKQHLETWRSLRSVPLRLYKLFSDDITEAEQLKKENLPYKGKLPHPYHINSLILSIAETVKGERVVLGLPNEISKADVTNTMRLAKLTDDEIQKADETLAKILK